MRILVIGGRGFLGRQVVQALRRVAGADVVPSSRDGAGDSVALDILDSTSRPAMAGFDVVVNCSDSVRASPQKAAEYCLLSGITFVETSADVATIEGLWETARAVRDPSGVVVLGAGLHPGVSNLLAASLFAGHPGAQRLEVGVRYSPFSRAGPGVCRLMAAAAGRRPPRFQEAQRVLDPPVAVGGEMTFGAWQRNTLAVGLPESVMLRWSTGVANTGCLFATVPGMPVAVQRVLSLLVPWGWLRWSPLRTVAAGALWLVRGALFGWRGVPIELEAVVDRGSATEARRGVRVADGFAGAAAGVAAVVAVLGQGVAARPGVFVVDQLMSFDQVAAAWAAIGPGELRLRG